MTVESNFDDVAAHRHLATHCFNSARHLALAHAQAQLPEDDEHRTLLAKDVADLAQ